MADYTAESRFFTPDGLLRGSEAIRRFFVRLFEEFAKPGMSFERGMGGESTPSTAMGSVITLLRGAWVGVHCHGYA